VNALKPVAAPKRPRGQSAQAAEITVAQLPLWSVIGADGIISTKVCSDILQKMDIARLTGYDAKADIFVIGPLAAKSAIESIDRLDKPKVTVMFVQTVIKQTEVLDWHNFEYTTPLVGAATSTKAAVVPPTALIATLTAPIVPGTSVGPNDFLARCFACVMKERFCDHHNGWHKAMEQSLRANTFLPWK
jgi:hypothetical protein